VFGLTLASDFLFVNRLAPGRGNVDVVFSVIGSPPLGPGFIERIEPVHVSPEYYSEGEHFLYVYRDRLENCDILRFTGVADFYLLPGRILCHLLDAEYAHLIEIHLLGRVLSFWLERHGIVALHASAVVAGGHAIGFLASQSGGKSSIAASLMCQGHPLLSDDVLALHESNIGFMCHPGYRQMRMYPDMAEAFVGRYCDSPRVHPACTKRRISVGDDGFGSFCEEARPVRCLYLLDRRDEAPEGRAITITPVSSAEGVVALVGNSFLPYMLEAMGCQRQRLAFLARVVRQIPIRRIVYPTGWESLGSVQQALLEDEESVQAASVS